METKIAGLLKSSISRRELNKLHKPMRCRPVLLCISITASLFITSICRLDLAGAAAAFETDRCDEREGFIVEERSPGDPLPRIQLPPGYRAVVHAEGLSSPDGLALAPDGTLFVAEESAGRVSAVDEDGAVTVFVTGITSPEGIAFDQDGNLFVVEDVENGRLLRFDAGGVQTVVAADRDAPEGVAAALGGVVFITESNVQFIGNPFLFLTHVTRTQVGGEPEYVQSAAWFWSYSGITLHNDGVIYVANEASGVGTDDSIFEVDPATGIRTLFCSGLTACEGLRFSPGGVFPLFVAEEDTGGGFGRLSSVDATGFATAFATGFYTIEDVLIDDMNRIFVTEDATGFIIRIEPVESPTPTVTSSPVFTTTPTPTVTPSPVFTASPSPTQSIGQVPAAGPIGVALMVVAGSILVGCNIGWKRS